MVPPKTQNTIQMIFFSTCYVVLKGVKATYLNPYLRLHTVWKKRKRNSFVTQNLCRIDMVKEIRKTVKTMPKWKLKGMQYQWSALSPELLWRSGAAELELNPEVQGWPRDGGEGRLSGVWEGYGAKVHQRGLATQQMGSRPPESSQRSAWVSRWRITSIWKVHQQWMTKGTLKSLFSFTYSFCSWESSLRKSSEMQT